MQALTRTLQEVLQGDRRFIIPVYQRPYVWERERQWEPLWVDVEATAIRLAETRQAAAQAAAPASDADKAASPHFLGAIVLEQYPTATGDIDVRSVVDGQQRLTTIQLLLLGTLDALQEAEIGGSLAAKLRKLTRNDEEIVTGDQIHKVWPRPAEREEYLAAISAPPPGEHESVFAAARHYFASAATEFLNDPEIPEDPYAQGEPRARRASLLVSTLVGLVKLVTIDLDDVDDAQTIFEALNARNTPLSATDLVKNLLFMRAEAAHHDSEELYHTVWARFDDDSDFWREVVGVGHAQRARQDWLLGDWLIAQLGRVISVGRLYGEFRRWLDHSATSAVEALQTLSDYADAYEMLHARREGASPAERNSFEIIDRLNITVATPVLLWLLTQPEERLPQKERETAFRAMESFVVRRMAAKGQTRAYGQAFAEVLRAAQQAEHPGRAIVEALRRKPHGYEWPGDEVLVDQFRLVRYYGPGGINQGRLRLLLGAVDRKLQNERHKSEPIDIRYEKLQVEHVIPKEWRRYWPVQSANPLERQVLEQERESHVNRIGNLTLASDRLNPSMGNDPWELKRQQLQKHSKLRLNALLVENDAWTEADIEERGEWLARQVSEIWRGPDAGAWNHSTGAAQSITQKAAQEEEVPAADQVEPGSTATQPPGSALTADQLLAFASNLDGGHVQTVARGAKFLVKVVPEGIEITPASSGEPRTILRAHIESVLETFNRTSSLQPSDYHEITFHSSYLLALIEGCVDTAAPDMSSAGPQAQD